MDLLPEIMNHLAAMEGVRALPSIASVCRHWRQVAVPLASSWPMLKNAGPPFPLVADKPTKASFVCSMPTAQARGQAPSEQDHSSLVVVSVGKDIRILCPRSGVALAEIQTAPGVWPSGLACDGRHLFAAGSLDCTLYKLEIVEASMQIVSARRSSPAAARPADGLSPPRPPAPWQVEACGGFGSGEGKLHSPQVAPAADCSTLGRSVAHASPTVSLSSRSASKLCSGGVGRQAVAAPPPHAH